MLKACMLTLLLLYTTMESSPPVLKQKPDLALSHSLESSYSQNGASGGAMKVEARGLKLIQLLLSCATHAASGNLHSADACLSQIVSLACVSGDALQRLSSRFASALANRLIRRWPGLHRALLSPTESTCDSSAQLTFARALPFLPLAHAALVSTLARTMAHEPYIHVLDLGSADPTLWVSLLRVLPKFPGRAPNLRITAVRPYGKTLDNLSRPIIKEAEALDINFQFCALAVTLRGLSMDMIDFRPGEALAVCSTLGLHELLAEDDHFGPSSFRAHEKAQHCKSLDEFLIMVRSMSPKVFTVVEKESDHNSTRLLDRFTEAMYHYCALFDAVEAATAAGSMSEEERVMVEDMLGREVEGIVASEGRERTERHEKAGKWTVRMAWAGLKPVRVWWGCDEETTKHLVGWAHGRASCKVGMDGVFQMICWHERPLYAVSAWKC